MAARDELKTWVVDALRRMGGSAHLVNIAKDIWTHREGELRQSGDLFYTWQYDMRWAGTKLREEGVLEPNDRGQPWTLTKRD